MSGEAIQFVCIMADEDVLEDQHFRLAWRDPVSGLTVQSTASAISSRFILDFPGQAQFSITFPDCGIVTFSASDAFLSETINHLLVDQVMPRVIAHRGDLVLHAGAVALGGRAVVVTAPSGYGKSTLTASLAADGATLIGDDALIVDSDRAGYRVRAVYPSLRLLPDSVAHLYGDAIETGMVAHYSAKRRIDLAHEGADIGSNAPLALILSLGPPDDNISARRLLPMEACMTLISNSFALDPTDTVRARDKLVRTSALATSTPAWELRYPRDYSRLREVHEKIYELLGD